MATKIVSSTQITLLDLNDAIISGTQPSSPVNGTLWIDSSQTPNILKQWNGSAWVTQTLALSSLDSAAATDISNAKQTLSDMANDSVVAQNERISIKDTITKIIGYVPTDTQSLPTYTTLDSGAKGEFYTVRKNATTVGISTTDSLYTTFSTNYTTLANYLNGLSPKPWDVTSTSNITITASTWRTNWYNYYDALYKLQQATQANSQLYVQSRGENLVTNGTGLLGNNTNFSAFTFDSSDSYFSKGSFKDSTYNSTRLSDEIMPVDVSKTYRLSIWGKANPFISGAHCYLGISEFDADKLQITSENHMYIANTATTLAQDLKPGDTTVYLTSAANWNNATGSATYQRRLIFWNYVNAGGYAWPKNTYSRNLSSSDLWADGSISTAANTITLRAGWTGSTIPAGTWLSQASQGGTYKYIAAGNVNIPNTWTQYTGTIGGIDATGNNVSTQFSYGTAGVKILFLNNRDVSGNTSWFSNISFNVDVASQGSVDLVNQAINDMSSDSVVTQSERISVKNEVSKIIGTVPTDTQSLPTLASLDSGAVGQLYQYRKAALNAGLTTSDTNYTNLGNTYTTLANYLNGLSPKPWDVTSTSKINITASTWRANWNGYYAALYQLDQATTAALQGNINGIQIGGKNLILDSGGNYDLVSTSYLVRSYTLSEDFVSGQQYTFMIKGTVPSGQKFGIWMNNGSSNVGYPTTTYANGVTFCTFTAVAPTSGNERKLNLYNYPSGTTQSTVDWVALYKGNKPQDWTPAPEDVQGNIDGVQVGGRNYIRNTSAFLDTTNWSLSMGDAIVGTFAIAIDDTYGNVLQATLSTNSATGNNWFVIENAVLTLTGGKFVAGQDYTCSLMIKNAIPLQLSFRDSDGTDSVTATSYAIPVNANWTQVTWTFTTTTTGVTPIFYLAKTDNTLTGDVFLTQVKLEDGNRPSGYSAAPEDTAYTLTTLTTSVNQMTDQITDDAMVRTVTNSTTYTNDLQAKADTGDLNGLATTSYVDTGITGAKGYADDKIKGLDFSPYVTTTALEQNNTDITAKFQSSGGVNMLVNSVGFAGTDFWTATGTVLTTQDPGLEKYGTKSAFVLNGATISQDVQVTPGVPYTISARVDKDTAGTGYMSVYEASQSVTQNFLSGSSYDYSTQVYSLNITPTSSVVTVELNGDATSGGVYFTAVMMNVGDVAFTWQQNPGEVYNTTVNFDLNGIRVTQIDDEGNIVGYTVMTPSKFAGYANVNQDNVIDDTTGSPDEIFRMDQDTFVMKSATINPIKIISVVSTSYNGIAFIPSTL